MQQVAYAEFQFIFCGARKEARRQKAASYLFRLILQKIFIVNVQNKSKPFTIPIIFMIKRSSCFHS